MGKERRKTGRPLRLTDLWSGVSPKPARTISPIIVTSTEVGSSSSSIDGNNVDSFKYDLTSFSSSTTGSCDSQDGAGQIILPTPPTVPGTPAVRGCLRIAPPCQIFNILFYRANASMQPPLRLMTLVVQRCRPINNTHRNQCNKYSQSPLRHLPPLRAMRGSHSCPPHCPYL